MNDATSQTASLLPDREWEKLLLKITKGEVVPVIGSELLRVPWEGKPSVRLYDLWGQELARLTQLKGMEALPKLKNMPQLYLVANRLFEPKRSESGDLESDIYDVIRSEKWPEPEALGLLAEISDFSLYLSATIDHLMYRALERIRKTPSTKQILFKRGGDKNLIDLPESFDPKKCSAVYHIFGAVCIDPGAFAATEDDLLDFSWDLIDREYAPARLFDFLKGKELLLLGCSFPDWLGRFFIHALTTREVLGKTLVTHVSSHHPPGFQEFLQRKQSRSWPPMSPEAFVRELHCRWQQKHASIQPAENKSESKYGAVFISYAREDKMIADAIKVQLKNAGIDTWMDESGLEPGVDFRDIIQDNIERASFFVAVISRSLDLEGSNRLGRFVLREWRWAEDVNLERRKDDCFLQPLVVDETPPGAYFIERPFRNLHWTALREGKLPLEFIDFLRKGIRRFREPSAGLHA